MPRPVAVMVTAFRDGLQSVFGCRVLARDYLPAVEAAREAGFTHFEAGGGAAFQSAFFYTNENAFDVMDAFRRAAGPDANLQTLARGISVVALDAQPRDIIRLHAQLFARHGITTIRNFDALNDVDNLAFSGRCIVEAGLRHEVVVTMMGLPPGCSGAHTPEFYLGVLRKILDAEVPFHSVCFKDASGTAPPAVVGETIRGARRLLGSKVHLRFHSHDSAGAAVACYLAALEAGVDGIDLSLAPVSGGTSQPDVLTLWHALRGTDYDLGLDVERVLEVERVLAKCLRDYFVPPEARAVDPLIPFSPMPGGALTANTQMMRDEGTLDRLPEVLRAMGEVVRRGGFGTSVTPVSQFYFQQAYNNVIFGPWRRIAEGYGKMVLGYFGRTPVPPDPEVVRRAQEDLGLPPAPASPLELCDADPTKGVAAVRRVLEEAGLPATEENVFIVATCGEKGLQFLRGRGEVRVRKKAPPAEEAPPAEGPVVVRVGDRTYTVVLDGGQAVVDGVPYPYEVVRAPSAPGQGDGAPVRTPLPGRVLRVLVAPGQRVAAQETLVVVEALKMEHEVKAPASGVVAAVAVSPGQAVAANQVVAWIR